VCPPPEIVHELHKCPEPVRKYLDELQAENERLSRENEELRARMNLNSKNSSKPPSSDGLKKPIKNNRKKSGKPSGGQVGHEGRTLEKVENPDVVVEYKTPSTCDCGCSMDNAETLKKTRQVFDIPKPKIIVTEHVTYETVCPGCGKVHKTHFPPEVSQPVEYGENMQALMGYFTQYQLLPLKRAAEAIRDITGQSISQGTLVNVVQNLYKNLEYTVEAIKQSIIDSSVVHFDETGMRSLGKTEWLHVASTDALTYYQVHTNRGEQAAKDIDILPNFKGTAVHDHWKPYYRFSDCTHAECNSHHLRYLKDILENYKQDWAADMISLLIEIHRKVDELKHQSIHCMSDDELLEWHKKYHEIIEKGIAEDIEKSPVVLNNKGKTQKSRPMKLLLRLQKYDIETLAFMYDFEIPFDNNLAERDIRMQKLRQKISGCFRGKNGAGVFCRVRSYISTARKNGIDAMDAISRAVKGQPFIP